jgi:hypothetical protein
MLNELCQLADALENAGISPKEWHPHLKLLPKASDKKPCYRISIAEDNSVVSVDELNIELAAILRKWEPSNGNSFPGFNIQSLYRLVGDDQKGKLKVWFEGKEPVDVGLLKSWCTSETDNWDVKTFTKVTKCLNEIPQIFLSIFKSNENFKSSSVSVLIERVIKMSNIRDDKLSIKDFQLNSFRISLENYLWEELGNGNSLKLILPILIQQGSSNKKVEDDRGSISVFLELSDWNEFPVAGRDSLELMNRCLIANSKINKLSDSSDAYGNELDGDLDKLPSVKLPIIADVKLRAMNSESLCQNRYGKIDAVSFPIGQESRKRAKGALEWLGDESREGETWGRADSRELFFAYPSILPEISVKLSSCFGASKSDDSEARFANSAQDVIKGLQGITKDLKNLNLNLFSLKKMDKARTKVVFHRNYSAQRLVDAAEEWQKGCANIPYLNIRIWGKTKGEWHTVEPVVPYPLQVSSCLNRVWRLDGSTECETPAIFRTQGVELLLEEHTERFTPYLLSVLLQNSKGLLIFLGNSQNKGDIISVKGYDSHKLIVPSILGLLLYKLGHTKEVYMANTPFLVGRMLKLADELHALYCKEVRDNNLPPQLAGNTLLTAALDSPVQALAQLALRIKPYYGWAQTFQKNDNSKLAGYFIRLYGETASQLSELDIPQRFNDTERAQLFLGYLASNPKKSDKQNDISVPEQSDIIKEIENE